MALFRQHFPFRRRGRVLPRLFLSERHENRIRWTLRCLTAVGIAVSVLTLPWYFSLLISVLLVLFDVFLEQTIFYFTSMYVQPLPDFEYDPDRWVANLFLSIGHPENPQSNKIVGLVFTDEDYAESFFSLLRAWNNDEDEDKEGNICLTFLTDEDSYYVYLYPSFERRRLKHFQKAMKVFGALRLPGKEHFGIVATLIICKNFDARQGYALGMFTDNHESGRPFLLAPYLFVDGAQPRPISGFEPILLHHYKAMIPMELKEEDFEYYHWRRIVRNRQLRA